MSVDTNLQPSFRFYFQQLWEYRELLQNLIKRDIKAQVKQSILGYVWIFVPPLFHMGIFTLLFQVILDLRMTENVPYPVYLYCMTLPWQMFANMVAQGTISMVSHGGLIKQVYFPKEVVILSVMCAEVFRTLITSIILVGLMIYYGIHVGMQILWLLPLIGLQLLFSFGLILPLAALNAYARDVSKGVGIFLSVWMYITPVIYPLEKVPFEYRDLYLINPMANLIQGYRQVILENTTPNLVGLGIFALAAVGIFLAGYRLFKWVEGLLADVI